MGWRDASKEKKSVGSWMGHDKGKRENHAQRVKGLDATEKDRIDGYSSAKLN